MCDWLLICLVCLIRSHSLHPLMLTFLCSPPHPCCALSVPSNHIPYCHMKTNPISCCLGSMPILLKIPTTSMHSLLANPLVMSNDMCTPACCMTQTKGGACWEVATGYWTPTAHVALIHSFLVVIYLHLYVSPENPASPCFIIPLPILIFPLL